MFGHVAERKRRWPWAIASFLFAVAFTWSFAVVDIMGERASGVWSIVRLGSAAGLVISLLRLVFAFISSRRLRRTREEDERQARDDDRTEMEAEGRPPTGQTEKGVPTYEEVFGLQLDLEEGGLPLAPEDEGWQREEGVPKEAEGHPPAEQQPADALASTSGEDFPLLEEELDGADDHVDGRDAEVPPQDYLQRIREEFKARAEQAALRVKQREAELHEAASTPDPER